ncbi:RDD family protein [Brachybacterium sp. FME24]|uniref:RDD family protein n=1 Tax=Brachybacterium sp. FME24 TaxID=2742605 RepID=UPI001866883A|nr:RDD family protein [Brachybacterium sp. FME24]
MHPLARGRLAGYLLDSSGYLGIAAAMLPLGASVNLLTDLASHRGYAYAISAVPPAIATVIATRAESGDRRATWGKHRRGLQVVEDRREDSDASGTPLSASRALLRNTVKIFVPWQLAHVTGVGAAWGGFEKREPVTCSAAVLTYATIAVFAVMCLRGSGRGPHDLAAGSVVIPVPATAPRSR